MRKWMPLLFVTTLVLLIDQIAKQWIIQTLAIGETHAIIPALQPYFQFTRTTNTGIAFGLGAGGSTLFLILSTTIIMGLFYVYATSKKEALLYHIALAIILGGAIGNVIDRLRFGHVVDFFHVVIPGIISNVSNFADHAIILGVMLLITDSYRQEQRQKHASETDTLNPEKAD